jgi:ATP-dependent protease ClpP protease subunit
MRPRPINFAPSPKVQRERAGRPGPEAAWYRIENAAGAAEVYIYDEIGFWGVSAGDFVDAIKSVGAIPINLHINSGGGDAWDGVAIYNAIRNHPAPVTVHVDGIAASAASLIAMAGDRVLMAKAATMMIHDAACFTQGNEADHIDSAALLGKLSGTIAEVYADRAGGEPANWRAAMRAGLDGTWYTAAEALAAGLIDEIAEPPAKAIPTATARPTVAARIEPSEPQTPPAPTWDAAAIFASLKEAVS